MQIDLLEATERCLHRYGLNGVSTRRVADAARMPLSQIHYHFGSKEDLILALLAYKNERLLNRQAAMYAQELPLWKRWKQACDYLDDDLSSGYVRVLQEMMAAGWSNPAIARAVRELLSGWFVLLTGVADEAAKGLASKGPFKSDEIASLVGAAFLGAESLLLLGVQETEIPLSPAPCDDSGHSFKTLKNQIREQRHASTGSRQIGLRRAWGCEDLLRSLRQCRPHTSLVCRAGRSRSLREYGKGKLPYLAPLLPRRRVRFGRGNGLSARPLGAEAYRAEEYVADAIAVMDATATERAVLVGFSFGGHLAALLAANHPERIVSAMLFAPAAPFGPGTGVQTQRAFLEPSNSDEGWAKYNRHYWRRDIRGFTEFFFQQALNEPHSTKAGLRTALPGHPKPAPRL